MRPAALLAALAASPFVQARVCRHSSKVPHSSLSASASSLPKTTSSPIAVATSAVAETPDATSIADQIQEPTTTTTTTAATSATTSATETKATATETAAPTDSSSSPPSLSSEVISGESTFYGGNLAGGTCSFATYTLPSSLYGVAYSGSSWNSASNCGACIKVTGPNGNSINAMIVDQCPECDSTHLDLFQNAFEQLGELSAGIISTSYEFIECGITSPIVLHSKSGTSAYWFSMQVVNANVPVASLEFSTDGGSSWTSTTRRDYNFFEYSSGSGSDTVDVRVTSSTGSVVTVSGVSVASDSQTTASSNF